MVLEKHFDPGLVCRNLISCWHTNFSLVPYNDIKTAKSRGVHSISIWAHIGENMIQSLSPSLHSRSLFSTIDSLFIIKFCFFIAFLRSLPHNRSTTFWRRDAKSAAYVRMTASGAASRDVKAFLCSAEKCKIWIRIATSGQQATSAASPCYAIMMLKLWIWVSWSIGK